MGYPALPRYPVLLSLADSKLSPYLDCSALALMWWTDTASLDSKESRSEYCKLLADCQPNSDPASVGQDCRTEDLSGV